MHNQNIGKHSTITKFLCYTILIIWGLIVVFPLYWMFITSFKLPIHVNDGPFYLPFIDFQPSLHAWKYILLELGNDTLRPYFNSIIINFFATIFSLFIGTFAAYGLSREVYRPKLVSVAFFLILLGITVFLVSVFDINVYLCSAVALAIFLLSNPKLSKKAKLSLKNSDILFWIISQRILPPVAVVIPIYILFQQINLLDTLTSLIITYTITNLPIVVWLMRDFVDTIPKELEESATIDGASKLRTLFDVILPLVTPGLASTALLLIILNWNEYLFALFLSSANSQTMPLLVAAQNATRGPQWWYMSTLIIIMIIPVLLITIILQRYIKKGLLLGAIKG